MKILLLLIISVRLVEDKVTSGQLKTIDDWVFLDKFCFLSVDGLFNYEIQFSKSLGEPNLLMYPDLEWENIYKNPEAESCEAKQSVLSPEKHQIIQLSIYSMYSGCEYIHTPNDSQSESRTIVVCRNMRYFSTTRYRWWFIAVANCNSSKGLELDYKFQMTNGKAGDYWREHLSANEFYILPSLISLCIAYLILLFTSLFFAVQLKSRQLFHVTYKIFLGSLGAKVIGLIFLSVFYTTYASKGIQMHILKLSGRIFESISELLFILLLFILGKGLTITRGRLHPSSVIKLGIFLLQYFIIFTILVFFQEYFLDPGKVFNMHDSVTGYGILFLRFIAWLMFLYGVVYSLKHFPKKIQFYLVFTLFYTIWFLAGPIIVLAANYLVDSWIREKIIIITEYFVSFVGHISFLFLARPSAANKNLLYQTRMSQVGAVLSVLPLKQFHKNYTPKFTDTSGRTVDISILSGIHQHFEDPSEDKNMVTAVFGLPPPKYLEVFPNKIFEEINKP